MWFTLELTFTLLFCVLSAFGENIVTQNRDGSEGSISFKTPDLNDEEAHSVHMPEHLKCDACTAIVYQVHVHVDIWTNTTQEASYKCDITLADPGFDLRGGQGVIQSLKVLTF